jgi:hypothetical protein
MLFYSMHYQVMIQLRKNLRGTWIPFTGTIDLTNVTSYTVQIREDDDTLKSQEKIITSLFRM